jgi:hypothetical protein
MIKLEQIVPKLDDIKDNTFAIERRLYIKTLENSNSNIFVLISKYLFFFYLKIITNILK